MTDRMAKQVINRVVIPNFKKNRYYEGLDQATDMIIDILSGEFEGKDLPNKNKGAWFPFLFKIVIFLLIIFNKQKHGVGSGGRRSISPSLLDMLILGSIGSSDVSCYNLRGGVT